MIEVMKANCPQNHRCPLVQMCPMGAISQDGNRAPEIDRDKCTDCRMCTVSCPFKAVRERVPA